MCVWAPNILGSVSTFSRHQHSISKVVTICSRCFAAGAIAILSSNYGGVLHLDGYDTPRMYYQYNSVMTKWTVVVSTQSVLVCVHSASLDLSFLSIIRLKRSDTWSVGCTLYCLHAAAQVLVLRLFFQIVERSLLSDNVRCLASNASLPHRRFTFNCISYVGGRDSALFDNLVPGWKARLFFCPTPKNILTYVPRRL